MQTLFAGFTNIWVIVVAVSAHPGERLEPLTLAAKNVRTNDLVEIGTPMLLGVRHPPYSPSISFSRPTRASAAR